MVGDLCIQMYETNFYVITIVSIQSPEHIIYDKAEIPVMRRSLTKKATKNLIVLQRDMIGSLEWLWGYQRQP